MSIASRIPTDPVLLTAWRLGMHVLQNSVNGSWPQTDPNLLTTAAAQLRSLHEATAAAAPSSATAAAVQVVRELAALSDPLYWDVNVEPQTWRCLLCSGRSTRGDVQHADSCPWVAAVELVRAWDGQS